MALLLKRVNIILALIILVVGTFISNLIDDPNSRINSIPVIGDLFTDKIKENKCMVVVLCLALLHLIL